MAVRRLSLRKKFAFSAITLFLVIGVIEGISFRCLCLARLDFNSAELSNARSELADGLILTDAGNEVIHPYLGWILNLNHHLNHQWATSICQSSGV